MPGNLLLTFGDVVKRVTVDRLVDVTLGLSGRPTLDWVVGAGDFLLGFSDLGDCRGAKDAPGVRRVGTAVVDAIVGLSQDVSRV